MERSELLFLILSFLLLWNPLVLARGQLSPPTSVGGGDDDRRRLQTYIVHVQKPKNLHAIGGFAARLTPEEVEAIEAVNGFLLAQPDAELVPRTTHTPKFLGLTRSGQFWEMAKRGEGQVISVREVSFYSDQKSFKDAGMLPPPARWKGACEMFNASGIPYNPNEDRSHGSHVASTAAGNYVPGANYMGQACGVAVGTAPRAHLAFYSARSVSDWLRAVDQAVDDGIDVLSISVSLTTAPPFYNNPLDIATLAAARRGAFGSVAAGNDGPERATLLDNTPWSLSVGASTSDRMVRTELRLGDESVIPAECDLSMYSFFPVGAPIQAVFPGYWTGNESATHCRDEYLGGENVTGKPTCNVRQASGKVGVVLNEKVQGSTLLYGAQCVPAVHPVGTITGVRRSPAVAYFSAWGPSLVSNGVLRPDIVGPGVNVLATTNSHVPFFFLSDTSMACPHLSGIAALLRSVHPTWSPAMIKSAMMTTSDWLDNAGMPIADETGEPADLYATGAGHKQTNAVLGGIFDCAVSGAISGEQLNYPTFSVRLCSTPKVVTRTLTVSIEQPPNVWISVFPRKLDFSKVGQKRKYKVTIASTNPRRLPGEVVEGQLSWISAQHIVRSPISIVF
ncbi:unnamed protein product [Spirodela intermedia]|uniref:Uncharacterized protein n=1 Tax=Spirodela intermedia TaxID=51605 RepID=A0A7I8L8M6_SPIIN|nr:unnamed protein product [Spirodela intermedia]